MKIEPEKSIRSRQILLYFHISTQVEYIVGRLIKEGRNDRDTGLQWEAPDCEVGYHSIIRLQRGGDILQLQLQRFKALEATG